MTLMKAPAGLTGFCLAGAIVPLAGPVDVPLEHIETLFAHGFTFVDAEEPASKTETRDPMTELLARLEALEE